MVNGSEGCAQPRLTCARGSCLVRFSCPSYHEVRRRRTTTARRPVDKGEAWGTGKLEPQQLRRTHRPPRRRQGRRVVASGRERRVGRQVRPLRSLPLALMRQSRVVILVTFGEAKS
eukprot:scaffold1307_cov200-Pinguiococcus_pyrenoidosus.AAC.21